MSLPAGMNHYCMQRLLHFLAQTWTRITSILQNVTNWRICDSWATLQRTLPFHITGHETLHQVIFPTHLNSKEPSATLKRFPATQQKRQVFENEFRDRDTVCMTVRRSKVFHPSTHEPAACFSTICMLQLTGFVKKKINKSLQKRTGLNQEGRFDGYGTITITSMQYVNNASKLDKEQQRALRRCLQCYTVARSCRRCSRTFLKRTTSQS